MPEFKDCTYKVIGCAIKVHNELGPGLREKPYENALVVALKEETRFKIDQQRAFPIYFRAVIVGDCIPDITVDNALLIDAKSIDSIGEAENAQMLNYLRISKLEVGLIINFKNPKLEWKRVVRSLGMNE